MLEGLSPAQIKGVAAVAVAYCSLVLYLIRKAWRAAPGDN